ncbi:MAG TPA: cell division protein FtsK [Candidatus Peribacter riflensis]|uniref:DNA segregation ATPase FtsK/SpoIIIE, S-DNA-T family n=1 Tax=Candidatus Peribacter riflensis TaxID=1735162 RepID=A0A0S1SSX0_9BACT|nr:MAG: DNA segregation ATPase FtsK/SpoIIIE, S-DNA-T family [Candidatus Peribacter riflensis]ALM10830.1 MAG: DNA segregation ATPase FtsK/SpoIIIE, S-DNA-T family [Candidatus Peribacter riflensis]ALM11932.1 MAG: DNA segregation ATPase FtsK/SpoIIIE, S-DNA-T family [Candidatus Peribacter riflensis]ALM13035.1 MAG: DNA segregation ATPase FtsK/SpoIIIE, S-DNA-T family [Candidatus Peribacter riflensis]ALM14135.1 MAG: DNA segregation ATPase FtsK/SpoIIIE, S-DNA-T family [Candidatus Peribacter riflensis]
MEAVCGRIRTVPRHRRTLKRPKKRSSPGIELSPATRRQVSGVVQFALGVLILLSLREQAGSAGGAVRTVLTFFFGKWSIIFPSVLIISALLHFFTGEEHFKAKRSAGLVLCLASFLGLMHIGAPIQEIATRKEELGGAIGFLASVPFLLFFSRPVGYTVLGALFFIGIVISFEPNLGAIVQMIRDLTTRREAVRPRPLRAARNEEIKKAKVAEEETDEDLVEQDSDGPELNIVRPAFAQKENKKALAKKIAAEKSERNVKAKIKDILQMKDTRFEEWTFPGLDLLEDAHSELTIDDEELKLQARKIEEKLEEFEIEVTMRDAHPGPTVTQFTLLPAEGVKLSKIENLKDDLALALAAPSLRIQAPIPGKSLVGLEMPNSKRTTVHLREILESPEFTQSTSQLSLPLGRDVGGAAVVTALNDMPHLLIAGATGSGKSVCMNTFLTSLLYQNAPNELKFILIDPKRVELTPYDGIPHLLTPVISESEKALQALRWAVAEMGRRLHRFSDAGARNLDEYNEKQTDEENLLPRIIIVVDELADLMMRQYRRDTETMIARIAQMARAVGMHLIIATQRPSVDVITGLIKANIPTRIAFRTVSAVDSRTILDGIGAEDLLGKGDMLYMTASTPDPVRIQGIFVATKEVERVINAVKIAGGGRITEQIAMAEDEEGEEGEQSLSQPYAQIDLDADDNGGDDLFFEAVKVVQETGKASASLLQRRMSVGYARAAKLLDIMEQKGLIGPVEGAKARKVYIEKMATP